MRNTHYNSQTIQGRRIKKEKATLKTPYWFDFCQRHRHTRDTCWKINGRPTISQSRVMIQPTANAHTWQPHQAPTNQSNQLGGDKNDFELLKEKVKHLESILSNSTPIIGSTSVANSGKKFILNKIFTMTSTKSLTHVEPSNSWILDSGATYHMTPIHVLFSSFVP